MSSSNSAVPRANVYTGSTLDRVSAPYADAGWVAARRGDPSSIVLPVWRGASLLRMPDHGPIEAALLQGDDATMLRDPDWPWVLLGLQDGQAVFALDLGAVEAPLDLLPRSGDLAFADLRAHVGALPASDAATLAHARGMLHWRARHRFCGVCGVACAPTQAGRVLRCSGCSTQHFPRTAPAVIMLVIDGDRALLGHARRFATSRTYSTLAGYVEPGESLEEAVAREVREEAGIIIGNVVYHSSQPWPFPSSLMLGFYAEALTTEIIVDQTELVDARWFTRATLKNPAAHDIDLPRADSIAHRLIEDWLTS